MENKNTAEIKNMFALVILLMFIFSGFFYFGYISVTPGRSKCSDFSSQSEANKHYQMWLDTNHNHKACEMLPII